MAMKAGLSSVPNKLVLIGTQGWKKLTVLDSQRRWTLFWSL